MDRVREANNLCDLSDFLPFSVVGRRVGFVRPAFAERLTRWPEVFRVGQREGVRPATELDQLHTPVEERTRAVEEVLLALRGEGLISGWRDELYPVNRRYTESPYLLLERAAVPFFGVCGYGVHMNGYVGHGCELKMWVGRRAWDKPTSPGKLDQLAAGGQPFGIGLRENMIKECLEEAGAPYRIAKRMVPVGAVTYCLGTPQGVRPDVIFAFDLELPPDFEPINTDGEMTDFYLWPVEKVIETVRDTTEFKYNCALVIIDFLIRHGFIAPDHPDYVDLLSGLRNRERLLDSTFP
jgi:hypothetical protein